MLCASGFLVIECCVFATAVDMVVYQLYYFRQIFNIICTNRECYWRVYQLHVYHIMYKYREYQQTTQEHQMKMAQRFQLREPFHSSKEFWLSFLGFYCIIMLQKIHVAEDNVYTVIQEK